jgi:1-phosphofructokinase family hexose kinase
MRPELSLLAAGGKGLDTALVLKTLGAPVESISFVAGRNGQLLAGLLEEKDIPVDWLWVEGETRIAHVIVETELHRHSHITTQGYIVSARDCEVFLQRVYTKAPGVDWGVIAGSLPGGAPATFYRDVIDALHASGVPALIDTAGKPMLEALAAHPEIVKMNQAEFTQTFGLQPITQEDWIAACRAQISAHQLQTFVLTCGKEGFFLFTDQTLYHACPPQMEAVNAAGSGDAVSAALVFSQALGDDWTVAARWAAAASAAVVLTEGTAECHMEDVHRIFPMVQISSYPDNFLSSEISSQDVPQ